MQVRAAGWLGQRGLLWFLSPRPAGRWVAPGEARPEQNPVLTWVRAIGLLRALRSRKREGRVPRCHPLLCHQRTVSPRRGVLGEKWRRTLRWMDFGEPVFPGGLRALRCRPRRAPGGGGPATACPRPFSAVSGPAVPGAPGAAGRGVSLSEPSRVALPGGVPAAPPSRSRASGTWFRVAVPAAHCRTASRVRWPHSPCRWLSGRFPVRLAPFWRLGGSRAGAQRGGQLAPRAAVQLSRGRPALLQPTPSHTATAPGPPTTPGASPAPRGFPAQREPGVAFLDQ